jgi:hypothetical protein
MMMNIPQIVLQRLFVVVIAIRISALGVTAFLIGTRPEQLTELNPIVAPLFRVSGSLYGSIAYAIILLFALLLIYDSVPRTRPKWYGIVFALYIFVLAVSVVDLANDLAMVI